MEHHIKLKIGLGIYAHNNKVTLIVKKRNPSESGNFDESTQLVNPFSLVFLRHLFLPLTDFTALAGGFGGLQVN